MAISLALALSASPAGGSAAVARPVMEPATVVGAASAMTSTTQPFSFRANASWRTVRDSQGKTWAPRTGFLGGSAVTQRLLGFDIARTADDQLFSVSTLDATGFQVAVPRAGEYRVRLLMAEGYFAAPNQRVFDVTAEGTPLFTGVDIVRGAGSRSAYVRSAVVHVSDGTLDLEFVRRVDNPSVAAVEVVEIPPGEPAPPPEAVPAGDSSLAVGVWRQRVDSAPLDPDSSLIAEDLRRQVVDRYNGVAAVNAYAYNASVYTAPADTPRTDVGFWDCQNKGTLPPGLLDGQRAFLGVPIPEGAVPAAGTDAALTIHDPTTDQAWEFWKMRRNATTGGWEACWGGRIDQVSTSEGIFPLPYGASATGVLMAGGMISLDDVRRGRIDHAVYLGVVCAQAYPEISWPALRGDGNVADLYVIKQGQRLRLDPTLDLSTYDLTPVGRMIAEAAQTYGFLVSERSGAVAVVTESGEPERARTGINPWPEILGPSYTVLANFPWDHIQVIAADYGRPAS